MKRFLAAYGKPIKYKEVTSSLLEKYSTLPTELQDEWKQNGFSVYRRGLLWFTDPDEFDDAVKALFGERSAYRCVARTSFGDLILFDKDDQWRYFSAYTLDVTDY